MCKYPVSRFSGAHLADWWFALSGEGLLHEQVYLAVRQAIEAGRLDGGERLPSTRELAAALGVSRTSTKTAYEQLLAEGYVATRHGSGTFVAEREELPQAAPKRKRSRGAKRISAYAKRGLASVPRGFFELSKRDTPQFDFLYGVPDPELFPQKAWRAALSAASRMLPVPIGANAPQGLLRLRRAIASHLDRCRGVSCDPEQIVVTSGVQQGLQLTARVLCTAGERVALEEPGYPGAHAAFQSEGLELEPVPVDRDGLVVQRLGDGYTTGPRLVHVTPAHQFPTGAVLSYPRRVALLNWARSCDAVVLEDDYDSEYRHEGSPVESLHALDTDDLVIFAGSFSKTLSTDLRLGFLVVPEALVGAFVAARWLSGWGNPLLEQMAMALFIEEDELARHIRRSRKRYGERRAALASSLASEFGDGVAIEGDRTGLHLYVSFPGLSARGEKRLTQCARRHGIGLYPAAPCFIGRPDRGAFILGYGLVDVAHIPGAVRGLAAATREAQGQSAARGIAS